MDTSFSAKIIQSCMILCKVDVSLRLTITNPLIQSRSARHFRPKCFNLIVEYLLTYLGSAALQVKQFLEALRISNLPHQQ